MKAPEKIYRRLEGKYIKYYDYKPAKISYNEKEPAEYVRSDAFIEKAWDWVENNILSSNQQDKSRLYCEQFRKYMEG